MRTLVHTCFNPATESKPEFCSCRHRISKTERDQLLAAGAVAGLESLGLTREVVAIPGADAKRVPIARTISKGDIEAAYVLQNRPAATRIDVYGGSDGRGPKVDFWKNKTAA